jgi:hypothetical protein
MRTKFPLTEGGVMQWLIFCLLFITGLMVYFPVIFIRKINHVMAVLDKIEMNTRDLTNMMVR